MDIILDTNIYQANFSLKASRWEALAAYLTKTNSKLVIPYIVQHELILNYRAELKKAISDIKDSTKKFRNTAILKEYEDVVASIDKLEDRNQERLDSESASYINYIKNLIVNVIIEDLPNIPVKSIVDRALKKDRPFKISGEGLKDTVLWESLLAYCKKEKSTSIIFISNNTSDFGEKNLHPLLNRQATNERINVNYYNSIEDFISAHFKTIKDIKLEKSHIDITELESLTQDFLKSYPSLSKRFFESHSNNNLRYHDVQGVRSVQIKEIASVTINDVSADFKFVQAILICEMGVICVADHYHEFTTRFGDHDYDAYQDLDEIITDCVIGISIKLSNNNTWYDELEVTDVSLP